MAFNEEDLKKLADEVKSLKDKVGLLESPSTDAESNLRGRINVRGGQVVVGQPEIKEGQLGAPGIVLTDTPQIDTSKRAAYKAIQVNNPDTLSETIMDKGGAARYNIDKDVTNIGSNQLGTKITDVNFAETLLQHNPNDVRTANVNDSHNAFYVGFRTPFVLSRGRVVLGGSVLTDIGLNLEVDQLVGAVLFLTGSVTEAFIIASNTATQITITGTFRSASNDYVYQVSRPVFLGGSNYPWRRLYVQKDIRFGIGPTNNDTPTTSPLTTTFVMNKESDNALSTKAAWGSYMVVTSDPGAGFTLTPLTSYHVIDASTPRTSSATTAINDGSFPGQLLLLQGNSDTGLITIKNSANTKLEGDCTLGDEDTLLLVWDTVNWVEICRSNVNGNVSEYTAGETISAGAVVGLKNSYTDYNVDQDTYTDDSVPTNNHDTATTLFQKQSAPDMRTFLKWDAATIATWPATADIQKAILRVYYDNFSGTGSSTVGVINLTSDWTEDGTVTHNNQPTAGTYYEDESIAITTLNADRFFEFDITRLVRGWKEGSISNYGLTMRIASTTANARTGFASSERADTTKRPHVRIISNAASDGELYKVDGDDYNLVRNIVGVAAQAGTDGNTFRVYDHGKVTGQSISGAAVGKRLYAGATAGALTDDPTTIPFPTVVGKGVGSGDIILAIEPPTYIERHPGSGRTVGSVLANAETILFFAPADAQRCEIYFSGTDAAGDETGTGKLTVYRVGQTTDAVVYKNVTDLALTATWSGDIITVVNQDAGWLDTPDADPKVMAYFYSK